VTGKTVWQVTTLAAMIDDINSRRRSIIIIEDPRIRACASSA
jgi:Tfp pilus assembly pilus retraction ATPase PilT